MTADNISSLPKEYKQHKIFILEQPLDPKFKKQCSQEGKDYHKLLPSHASLTEFKEFLQSLPQCTKVLEKLDQGIQLFNSNYMILTDYLNDAVTRLTNLCEEGIKDCLHKLDHKLTSDIKFKDILTAAVESYVMGGVHQKVFRVLCQHHLEEDKHLSAKICQQVCDVTPQDLKVSPDFICPLPNAVRAMLELENLTTPLEKLTCLKSVIDNITAGITNHVAQKKTLHLAISTEEPCLTSDDLIPLLVSVIAQASMESPSSCQHLHSNISYMENFTLASTTKDRDELSYCLVTFRAAVQFIASSDFSENSRKKQNGVKKLTMAKQSMSVSDGDASSKNGISSPGHVLSSKRDSPVTISHSTTPPPTIPSGRQDRQRSRVSKVLQESSAISSPEQEGSEMKSIFGGKHSVPILVNEGRPQTQTPVQLGDFLSALQDDLCDQTFGKQA
ncbi:hypothetical protein C0Q70_08177 [Pomacea canaliculata]|uniref:VPS9 domain-containing protein n=1 Tax=Pomacea canaliculata TaxID=400727 RepID=A0A2T7PH34_POMCA|nr:hypothetical protein C0Q70_08177 [Pomacea canaliculata]